ncbi:EthD domain-containing protein [Streptomyces sp. NBC_00258]|uniref:EthD domain-containing protein n=1 Tax=Streptomyces sp. NBC_00258 TaxID=2903642 RepID=UPI002E28FFCD|nr:EthD domain-containing protein [Streptomyces sp. NBC_00258]
MYKVIVFLKKRDGLSREEFVDYYENRHVPLILSMAPSPPIYRRNYLVPEGSASDGFDFDVMVEFGFADKAAHQEWVAQMDRPENRQQNDDDSPNLFHPDSLEIREYVLEEHITS